MENCTADELSLPEDLVELAKKLGETHESRKAALDTLRSRLLQLPEKNIPADISDRNLIRYIRCRKYNIVRAFSTILENSRFKKANPEWFRIAPQVIELFKSVVKVVNEVDSNKQRIVIVIPSRLLEVIGEEFMSTYPLATIQFRLWLCEQLSHDVYTQIAGMTLVYSFQGSSWRNKIKLSQLASLYQHMESYLFALRGVGLRVKHVLLLEAPFYVSLIWHALKIFLSTKMKHRITFAGGEDYELMKKIVLNPEVLLICMGGEGPDDLTVGNLVEEYWRLYAAQSCTNGGLTM